MDDRIFHVSYDDPYELVEEIIYERPNQEIYMNKNNRTVKKEFYIFSDGLVVEFHDDIFFYLSTIENPYEYTRDLFMWTEGPDALELYKLKIADNNEITQRMNHLPEWSRIEKMIALNINKENNFDDIKKATIDYQQQILESIQEELECLDKLEEIKAKKNKKLYK